MNFHKFLKVFTIFFIIFAWVFSGFPQIWQKPAIPPEIEKTKASPAVANLILLWDPADGVVPTGWTCISCSGGQDFYQKFIRGNPTYGIVAGGSSTHTHPNASPFTSGGASGSATGDYGKTGAPVTRPPLFAHTHTASITSGLSGTNIPLYRNLKVIRYNNGIPSSLPQNIIAIFESAPSGWTTTGYNDGRYIQGENVSGTGGTANTHTHTIVLGQTSAGADDSGKDTTTGATSGGISHYHSSGAQATTTALNHEPAYMTVILAKKDAAGSIPVNMIGMFDNTPPSANWTLKSNIPGDPFYQRFFKPTGTYNTSSDVITHTHADLTITTGGPSGTTAAAVGTTFSSATHNHNFTITFGTAVNHEPPYWNAIFAQASSTPTPNLEQIHFHWRNDDNNEVNATSATGGTEDIVYSSFPAGENKRLRIEISNEGGAAGQDIVFRLDYGLKSTTCSAIVSWTDVGATPSDDWDMYDTANFPTDGADTTNITDFAKGAVSDANPNFKTPNYAVKDTFSKVATTTLTYEDFIEMEFSIKPNVTSGTYCFRVSNDGDITNFTYTRYAEATVAIAYTVGCNASTSTTDFGTLTPTAISTSTPDVIITASTTYPDGFILYVRDSNAGLYSTIANHLVTSTTALLEAGIAGYGIQATTTAAEITINSIYLKTGDDVGGLSTSNVVLASSTGPFPNREVKVKHKAAISNLTKAASDYTDTITYSCSGN